MLPRLASNFCAQGILPPQASGCWGYRSQSHWPHRRVLHIREGVFAGFPETLFEDGLFTCAGIQAEAPVLCEV